MAVVGFLQSLWEKPICEGVWPYWDPMDSVSLRTASMEWNVPRKYGPHCELFFFQIQKEPATMLGSETLDPCPIRTAFSLLMSSRSARLSPCTLSRKKEEAETMDVMLLVWGTNGKWAAQRVPCGRVKAKLCRKTKVCLLVALVKAMCATMRCALSGCMGLVARSLSLKDWELAKVALSCHMALDMLCQEMHEASSLGGAAERPAVTA